METIKTNAHAYNSAVLDIKKYQTAVTLAEVKAFCKADPQSKNCPHLDTYHAHCPELDMSLFYIAEIANKTIEKLQIEKNTRTEKIISGLAYNTSSYNRARKTVNNYQNMLAGGYTPIQDTTPEMDGQKARMVGESTGIMGTTTIDEKVTIVHTDTHQGYKKPRQRTRYYVPAFDAQTFIKPLTA